MSNLQNLAQERRDIVAKYDRGRDENTSIDPWEDPQFEVYHKRDRYGFIHDQRIPSGNDNKVYIISIESSSYTKFVVLNDVRSPALLLTVRTAFCRNW